MNTAANLLVILVFLAAFYTVLGLLCRIAEKVRELTAKPYQRQRVRRAPRRRTPRRALATAGRGMRAIRLVREETAYSPGTVDAKGPEENDFPIWRSNFVRLRGAANGA